MHLCSYLPPNTNIEPKQTMVDYGIWWSACSCTCMRAWMCVRVCVCVCTCVHSSLLTDLFLLTLRSQLCLLRRGPPEDGTAHLAECGHWHCSTVGQVSALLCVHTDCLPIWYSHVTHMYTAYTCVICMYMRVYVCAYVHMHNTYVCNTLYAHVHMYTCWMYVRTYW